MSRDELFLTLLILIIEKNLTAISKWSTIYPNLSNIPYYRTLIVIIMMISQIYQSSSNLYYDFLDRKEIEKKQLTNPIKKSYDTIAHLTIVIYYKLRLKWFFQKIEVSFFWDSWMFSYDINILYENIPYK